MLNKITMGLCGLSFGGVMVATISANRGLLPPTAGMYIFALSGLVGLLAAACALAVIFTTKTYPVAMFGLLSLIPFLTVAALAVQGSKYPMINDISTDLDAVPKFVTAPSLPANAGRDFGYSEELKAMVREHYSDVKPLILEGTVESVFLTVKNYAEARMPRWELTRVDEEDHVVEGTAATRVFKWTDDFVIRVSKQDDEHSIVDMRSKSRDGKSDLGANAARIQAFFEVLRNAP